MTLKMFHVFFIRVSALLAILVAVWAFHNGSEVFAGISILAVVGLLAYQAIFIRMSRTLRLK